MTRFSRSMDGPASHQATKFLPTSILYTMESTHLQTNEITDEANSPLEFSTQKEKARAAPVMRLHEESSSNPACLSKSWMSDENLLVIK